MGLYPLKHFLTNFENINQNDGPLSSSLKCEENETESCAVEASQIFVGWCKGISSKSNASSLSIDEIKTELTFHIDNDLKSECLKKALVLKTDQLAFFIKERGKISQRKTCGEYASTRDDLKTEVLSDAVWGTALETKYSTEIKDFRAAQIYPHEFKSFEFVACSHTATFNNKTLMVETNEKLLNHLKVKKPDVVEVERSDNELSCEMVVPNLFKSEAEVFQRGEHEVAIWYAVNNQKIIRGGEPEEEDFLQIIPLITGGVPKDYYFYKTHRCLAQLDMTERANFPTWELAYAHCAKELPVEFATQTDSDYRKWFVESTVKKPSAFRKIDCKDKYQGNATLIAECQDGTTTATDPKDLYDNPYFELLSTPVDGAEAGSMAYYSASLGHIKNFCLRKNLGEAKEQGSTSVIYGGGHLFENFELLTKMAK